MDRGATASTLVGLLLPQPAWACTICHSPTAFGVRHLLFEHDFVRNAAAVAAPIPLLLAIVAVALRERGTGR
jgi:hypothetical protein